MSQPNSARPEVLPWDDHHRFVEECVNKFGGRIGHCFRNAFNHLRRSWVIYPYDGEMSLFRAITAEEEAATALFFALSQRQYRGAKKLKERNHVHKSAVIPFLIAVAQLFHRIKFPVPKLNICLGNRPEIHLEFDVGALIGGEHPLVGKPDHPFNFLMWVGDDGSAYRFEKEIQALAEKSGRKSIVEMIKNEANLRNRLLYASDNGVPSVKFSDREILNRRDRVYYLALITIGILQTMDQQLFVQQCLDSFFGTIEIFVEKRDDDQSVIDRDGLRLNVVQQPDGSYDWNILFKSSVDLEISGVWLKMIQVSDVKFIGMKFIEL